MDGPDEPPRAAIRRRMVPTMVDVAAAGYDRWYILAHSLGSVVAWNGLMEIQKPCRTILIKPGGMTLSQAPTDGKYKTF